VLLVSEDQSLREQLSDLLEEDGDYVLLCPGTQAGRDACLGLQGYPCALERGVTLVVVDLLMDGVSPATGRLASLVGRYRAGGRAVLALVDDHDRLRVSESLERLGVTVGSRSDPRDTIVQTSRELLAVNA